jgi:hypothetical protein
MDYTSPIDFVHDGHKGFIVQVGPTVTVSCFGGENTFTFIGTYLQSGDCESAIIQWQVDCELEVTHTRIGALPWERHWDAFLETMPPAVRAVVAPYRDRFGFGEDF